MIVRLAGGQDTSGFLDLARQVEHWSGPMVDDPGFRAAIDRHVRRGTALVAVAVGAAGPLGGLLFGAKPPANQVRWLVISEPLRGQGVMCSGTYGRAPDGLPADITAAYRHALPQALTLLTQTLIAEHDEAATRDLLAAAAALKGHPALGGAFNDLGHLARCQNCGHLTPR